MADGAARARAEAIEGFAAVLRDLRDSVGNPSFREMSGRSRAISHTTLHEAAQGHRLPSWATTVEFVKACGADPGDYRERWEQATRAVRSARPSRPLGFAIPAAGLAERRAIHVPIDVPDDAPDDAPDDDDDEFAASAPPTRRWFTRRGAAALAAAAVVAVAVVVIVVTVNAGTDSGQHGGSPSAHPLKAQPSPADCPMHAKNPPPAPPAHRGDASAFIADITLPDCTHLRRGQTAIKVWRFKNAGTVPWTGYTLHRLDLPQQRNQCQTISDLPIDDTRPGELVDIRTAVTAPKNPGFCYVRFKMVDAAGHVAFPGSRPVNFQLIVD